MKANSKLFAGVASVLIVVTASVVPILAAAYTVGVKTGDWTKYEVSASWTGTGTEPSDITELKQTAWLKWEVQSVNGTTVTMRSITHYRNGTEKMQTLSGNIATASGNFSLFIIPAGLKKGNVFPANLFGRPFPPILLSINETVTRTCAGAGRSLNAVNITKLLGGTSNITAFWEQATGVLLEWSWAGQDVQETFKATETNVGPQDIIGLIISNPIYIVGIIIVVIVVIIAVVYIAMRRKPAPTLADTFKQPAPRKVQNKAAACC